jgi:hypothetical protein
LREFNRWLDDRLDYSESALPALAAVLDRGHLARNCPRLKDIHKSPRTDVQQWLGRIGSALPTIATKMVAVQGAVDCHLSLACGLRSIAHQ